MIFLSWMHFWNLRRKPSSRRIVTRGRSVRAAPRRVLIPARAETFLERALFTVDEVKQERAATSRWWGSEEAADTLTSCRFLFNITVIHRRSFPQDNLHLKFSHVTDFAIYCNNMRFSWVVRLPLSPQTLLTDTQHLTSNIEKKEEEAAEVEEDLLRSPR